MFLQVSHVLHKNFVNDLLENRFLAVDVCGQYRETDREGEMAPRQDVFQGKCPVFMSSAVKWSR